MHTSSSMANSQRIPTEISKAGGIAKVRILGYCKKFKTIFLEILFNVYLCELKSFSKTFVSKISRPAFLKVKSL